MNRYQSRTTQVLVISFAPCAGQPIPASSSWENGTPQVAAPRRTMVSMADQAYPDGLPGTESINHFLVLGAGASHGARDSEGPPLGSRLAEYILDWLDANDPAAVPDRDAGLLDQPDDPRPPSCLWDDAGRLRTFLQTARRSPDGVGFERAAGFLRGTDLLRRLHQVMTFSFLGGNACRFREHPDRLDHLVERLPAEGVAIATLNYDLLLEEALQRSGRKYWYSGIRTNPEQGRKGIALYKIHGSVNWLQSYPPQRSATDAGARRLKNSQPSVTLSGPDQGVETQRECVPPGGRRNLISELKNNAKNAVLALYSPGKPGDQNWECLDKARDTFIEAATLNPDATVTVIGVTIPDLGDDPTLDEGLRRLGRSRGTRVYVGPENTQRDRAFMLGFQPGARDLAALVGMEQSGPVSGP